MKNPVSNAELLKAAALFTHIAAETPDPKLVSLCAQGLTEMAENRQQYAACLEEAAPFWSELCETVRSVCAAANYSPATLYDKAFCLMECLAVITRENVLKSKAQTLLPAQADIMCYFEDCGHWAQGDGTLVSDYYYRRIPGASIDPQPVF